MVILSDRHPGLLRSVPELFGGENHGYCYRHLKDNFNSFFNKYNKKGTKGRKMHCNGLIKLPMQGWRPITMLT